MCAFVSSATPQDIFLFLRCSRAPQVAATAISGLKTFDTMHDMIQVPVADGSVLFLFLFLFLFLTPSAETGNCYRCTQILKMSPAPMQSILRMLSHAASL